MSIRARSARAVALSGAMLGVQMFAYLVAVRLLVGALGTESFGTFQLIRQVTNFATPVLLLGLNVALVQRLGGSLGDEAGGRRAMLAAALVAAAAACLVAVLRATEPTWLSQLVLSRSEAAAARSMLGLLAAMLVYTYVYATYRGRQAFLIASSLQALCFGLVPLGFAAFYADASVYQITDAIAAAILLLAGLSFLPQLRLVAGPNFPPGGVLAGELAAQIHYGVRRMFIPLLFGLMMTLGPIALTHAERGGEAGAYLVAMVVFRAIDPALTTVAVVMLPMLSQASGERHARAVDYAELAQQMTLGIGGFLAVFVALLANWLAVTFFGPPEIGLPLRIVALALPFSIYLLLAQPLIDATTTKAVVLRALLIGFGFNAAGVWAAIRWAPHGVAVACALGAGYAAAGMYVWRHVRREFGARLPGQEAAKVGAILAAVALPSWLLLELAAPATWAGAAVAVAAPLAYLIASRLARVRWALEAERLLRATLPQTRTAQIP